MSSKWQEEVDRRLDQIAVDAEDWEAVVDMLAEVAVADDTFYDYLGLLSTRVKQMRRRMNRITFHTGETRHYRIWNYSFEMYSYFKRHYPDQFVETPFYLAIPFEVLSERDREQFQQKVEPL